ncbi:MAG: hypothetical protein HRU11_12115 [Parvularculaceae bacterium]|nr:hypothetical protein [Parvularculaceae bacterium]
MEEIEERRSGGGVWKFLLFLVILAVAGGTFAVYQWGDGFIYINDKGLEDLQPWEVVGGVIIGILGLIVGLVAGAIGLLIGLGAALLAIALAMLGIFSGLFITAGVLLGPFLLLAAIILMMRRRTNPEVI